MAWFWIDVAAKPTTGTCRPPATCRRAQPASPTGATWRLVSAACSTEVPLKDTVNTSPQYGLVTPGEKPPPAVWNFSSRSADEKETDRQDCGPWASVLLIVRLA